MLNSYSEQLTEDGLLLWDQQRASEDANNDTEEKDNVQVKISIEL